MDPTSLLATIRQLGLTSAERPATRLTDEPFIPAYWCTGSAMDIGSREEIRFSGYGSDIEADRARVKAHAECLETFCLHSPPELILHGEPPAASPTAGYSCFSPVHRRVERVSAGRRYYYPASNLLTRIPTFVPAQLVGLFALPDGDERILPERSSVGTAFGLKGTGLALQSALLELLERDAVLRAFHGKSALEKLDDNACGSRELFRTMRKYRLQPHVLLVPSCAHIPIVLTVLVDLCPTGLAISTGSAAGLDLETTVRRSAMEAVQGRSARRVWMMSEQQTAPPVKPDDIETINQRMLFWSQPSSPAYLDFWVERQPCTQMPSFNDVKTADDLIKQLDRSGIEFYVADITNARLATAGFEVIRVMSPQLVPGYSKESSASFWFDGHHRNPIPHPFF